MAGLYWMAVMLTFLLSAENGLAVVDQNRLARFVTGILREYKMGGGMFSLAVSIPEDNNKNINDILKTVFTSDPYGNVSDMVNTGNVYQGSRVVAAKVQRRPTVGADHAESRVVDKLGNLFKSGNENDLLLFYVFASPCVEKCASIKHHESILERINDIKKWKNYALVFSKIFKPNDSPSNNKKELSAALQRIGMSIGLDNIFRCDWVSRNMQCDSCSNGGEVAAKCVSDPPTASASA